MQKQAGTAAGNVSLGEDHALFSFSYTEYNNGAPRSYTDVVLCHPQVQRLHIFYAFTAFAFIWVAS